MGNKKRDGFYVRSAVAGVSTLVVVVVLVLSLSSRGQSSPPTSAAPTSTALSSTSTAAAPEPDFVVAPQTSLSSLAGLSGIDGAVVVVEATVVEHRGPTVELHESGFVNFDSSSGFPSLIVSDIDFVADLGSARVEMVEAVGSIPSDSMLTLWYSDGLYEVGRRYAFFLGAWSGRQYSTLYGHDLETDRPALGLAQGGEDVLDRINSFAEQEAQGADVSLLDELIAIAGDLNAESQGADLSERAASALGVSLVSEPPVIPVRPDASGTFPLTESEASPTELTILEYIELTVLLPEGFVAEVGLEAQSGRYLGWFEVNDFGYAVISGLVPRARVLAIVERGAASDERSKVAGRQPGRGSAPVRVVTSGKGETFGFVDLRSEFVVIEMFDEAGYRERLDDLPGTIMPAAPAK